MFLNRLTPQEKCAYLQIAHHEAHSDAFLSKEEEDVIAKYCMEMQMDDIEYSEASFDLSRELSYFSADSHKIIALLEIMALVFADGVLVKEEERILNEMIAHFELNPYLAIVYNECSKSILSLFIQGEALIHI